MIVIEASAMVSALVNDPIDSELLALLADEELHASALLDFEVASALRGHVLGVCWRPSVLSRRWAEQALADFTALQIERHAMTYALRQILDLQNNLTAYDASYVVLALGLDARLVTSDTTMREAQRLGVHVQILPAPHRS